MTDLSAELAFAHDVARLGGKIAAGHFRRDPRISRKNDGTWVSEADWAVEAQIRLRIARAFPDHNVLGEEEGWTASGGGKPRPGAPTWVVDPIDGTDNYIAGIPVWATLVGLRIDDEAVVGVCHAPILGETYDAARGLGARFNGEPIHVDDHGSLSEATVLCASLQAFEEAGLRGLLDALVERSRRTRGFGDFWGHVLVARGSADVMVEPRLSPWDVVALQPIVAEAGGRLTHLKGEPWVERGSCLTTNGTLHEQVVALAEEFAPSFSEHDVHTT